ncbi:MAG: DUF4838 domain-containing protein [Bacteroidota bacterium]
MRSEVSQLPPSSGNLFHHPTANATSINLSRNGIPLYDILLPEIADEAEERSAYVLQFHLQKICNAKFPIVKERSNRPYISIGKTKAVQRLTRQSNKLGEEGYEILVEGKNLFFIADGPIGIVNASLAFLEEDLGIRWWGKQKFELYVPETSNIELSIAPRFSKPAFEYREPYFNIILSKQYFNHNRIRVSRGVAEIPTASWQPYKQFPHGYELHSFRSLVPGNEFAASHPEYYSEKNGQRIVPNQYNLGTQLCLSNHELASVVAKKAKAILDKTPTATKIHVSQNDGAGMFCDCHKCQKINQREGGNRSGSLIYFVNRVADELKESHPDVKVVTFAYKETARPPKSIQPRDNVIVELCTDLHWGQPLIPVEDDANFVSIIDGWNQLGTHLYIWDYAVDFSNYLIPWPNLEVIARNIKFYQQKGVKGVLLQGAYQGYNQGADRANLKAWVWGKLMWDPDLDFKALATDFNNAMFLSAAKPVNQYNALMQSNWEAYYKRNKVNSPFLGDDFKEKSLKLIDQARAQTNDAILLTHIGYWEASVIYHRLIQGPKDEKDINAYNKDLDRFLYLCKTYDIRRLHEQPLQKGNIDRYVTDMRVKAENIKLSPTTNSVRFHEQGFFLPPVWDESIKPKVTKDPKAENNYAMSLSSSVLGWRMNLYMPPEYKGDKEYKLNISMRVDWNDIDLATAANDQKILQAFVYDEKTKGVLLRRFIYLHEMREDKYINFEIGNFSPKNRDRIIVAPMDKKYMKHFYVDYIEIEEL